MNLGKSVFAQVIGHRKRRFDPTFPRRRQSASDRHGIADRLVSTLDHKLELKVTVIRQLEVFTGPDRRRRFGADPYDGTPLTKPSNP
jgi:hypothetical protein